jgi:hypothetical protein
MEQEYSKKDSEVQKLNQLNLDLTKKIQEKETKVSSLSSSIQECNFFFFFNLFEQ